ncbi:MAG: hypothetical protein GY941_22170 [Planctomycetes bacterium]|nr:hypothetical protein [Planctomycetota bacterium]
MPTREISSVFDLKDKTERDYYNKLTDGELKATDKQIVCATLYYTEDSGCFQNKKESYLAAFKDNGEKDWTESCRIAMTTLFKKPKFRKLLREVEGYVSPEVLTQLEVFNDMKTHREIALNDKNMNLVYKYDDSLAKVVGLYEKKADGGVVSESVDVAQRAQQARFKKKEQLKLVEG